MLHVVITQVDSVSKQPCTEEPMRTGPSFPSLKNLVVDFFNGSEWPIEILNGVYQTPPKFYATCDDDSFTGFPGVLDVISEAEFNTRKREEFYARKPYPSWVFDENTLLWSSPVPMPTDGSMPKWDEATLSWVE